MVKDKSAQNSVALVKKIVTHFRHKSAVTEQLNSAQTARDFSDIENNVLFSVATLLDPRYKRDYFANMENLIKAENLIREELTKLSNAPSTSSVAKIPNTPKGTGLWANRSLFSGSRRVVYLINALLGVPCQGI